jgi:hypothetical protein
MPSEVERELKRLRLEVEQARQRQQALEEAKIAAEQRLQAASEVRQLSALANRVRIVCVFIGNSSHDGGQVRR